jgi:acetylornithine deacetylase/succinyl-diaminopimelate desuccinylase-like protein
MRPNFLSLALLAALVAFAWVGVPRAAEEPSPALKEVLKRIDRDDLVRLTTTLVKIPSDYSEGLVANHKEIATFLEAELRKLGLDVTVVEPEPNYPLVVGRMKGSGGGPVLEAMGHYNTVPVGDRTRWHVDPLGAEVRDGKIWGRGAFDQKGTIAALLIATRAIIESGIRLKGDLIHVYIPAEGAQDHVLRMVADTQPELIKANWCLDTDGEKDIVQIAAGHLWIKIMAKGTSAHPGGDRPWVDAATELMHVLVAMEDPDKWMKYEMHPLFTSLGGKPRVVVGMIQAGRAVNQVPETAEARVDIRLNPKQTPEGVLAELDALVAKLKATDPALDVTVEKLPGTQHVPYSDWASITPDDPLVKTIREVSQDRLGRMPGFVGTRSGGRPDLWRIGTKWISWSATEGANAHAPDEWVSIDALYRSAQVYAEIILKTLHYNKS